MKVLSTELSTEKQDSGREIMNTEEVGEFLGRTPGAIRNMTMRKVIPFRKASGRLVFFRREIVAWIDQSPGVHLEDLEE